jgi:hypothetical protein
MYTTYKVWLDGKLIDTYVFKGEVIAEEAKEILVNEKGFNPDINLVLSS